MTKSNLFASVRKTLAVLSAFAVVASGGITGLFDASISASADGEILKTGKIYVYDEFGNDITENPVVYVENSSAAGQSTSTKVTVKLVDDTKDLTERFSRSAPGEDKNFALSAGYYEQSPGEGVHEIEMTFDVQGCKREWKTLKHDLTGAEYYALVETPYAAGQDTFDVYYIESTNYVKITVINQEPATDLNVTFNGGKVEVNDYNMYNSNVGYRTFTDKKYSFSSSIVTGNANVAAKYKDTVEWGVYEKNKTTGELVPTELAEISKDGVFTPKKYGQVVVVAYFAPTDRIKKRYEAANKALAAGKITEAEMPSFETNPLTGEISDRLRVNGTKKRNIYMPEVDSDGDIILEGTTEDYSIVWQRNKTTGARIMKTSTELVEAVRGHYYVDDSDALYSDPWLNVFYKFNPDTNENVLVGRPVGYEKVNNMPKYINIDIVLRNPADSVTIAAPGEDPATSTQRYYYMDLNGGAQQLESMMHPSHDEPGYQSGATDVLTWTSSDPSIVEVDQNGVITPKKKGTVEIKAYGEGYKDGTNERVSSEPLTVTVFSKAGDITLDPSALFTRVGVPIEISAIEGPEKLEPNDEIEWSVSDPTKVQIIPYEYDPTTNIQKAQVIGLAEGQAYITAQAKRSGEGVVSNNCQVTVNARNLSADIKLSADSGSGLQNVEGGDTLQLFTTQDLTINASPVSNNEVTADDTIEWTIYNNDGNRYVTVPSKDTKKIQLHGIAEGTITLVATCASTLDSEEVISKAVQVKVLKQCDSVNVIDSDKQKVGSANVASGNSVSLFADLRIDGNYPYEHSDTVKSWESSNPSIASVESAEVDEKGNLIGVVTAKSEGTATITVTTQSGKKASANITVFTTSSVSLSGVTANSSGVLTAEIDLNNELKGSKNLGVVVRDQDNKTVKDPKCEWTSSNEDVATVSLTGVVTAHDVGETTITVKSGTKSESCVVSVYAPISAVKFDDIVPYVYDPQTKYYEPHPVFTIGSHTLTENVHYAATYSNNSTVGRATMTLTGMDHYLGQTTITYNIEKRPLTDEAVAVSYIEEQECTGTAVTPAITVTCNGISLVKDTDYTVAYTNNIKPGTATVKVTGKGCYSDATTKTFTITCHHTNLRNVTVLKKPTYDEMGLETGTCAACGEKHERSIPKLEHTSNPALSLSFEKDAYGVERGKTLQLEVQAVTPTADSAPTDTFRWVSDNPRIATVDDNGVVKGIASGKTTVTVYGENDYAVASCEIGVVTIASEIIAEPASAETRIDVSIEVTAELKPAASDDEIVWSIADPSIATIEPSATNKKAAIVTGHSVGQTTITAKAKYSDLSADIQLNVGERNASDLINISTVIDGTPTLIPNSSGSFVYTHNMFTNQDIVFESVLTDMYGNRSDDVTVWQITNNENDTITLPNNDPGKDVVADSIKIHATSLGMVTVTAFPQTKPELKTTFNLAVTKSCNNIKIRNEIDEEVAAKSLNVDDHLALHADLTTNDPIHPYDHGDSVFSWVSSDPEVAEVDKDGNVTAKKIGQAVITMTTLSEKKKTVNISVFTTSGVYLTNGVAAPADPTQLPSTSIAFNNNFEAQKKIGVTVYDQEENAVKNVDCKWTSSNENIATVDEKGTIIAKNVGEVMITVQSGSKSQSFMVSITAPMTAVVCTPDPIPDFVYSPNIAAYVPDVVLTAGPNTLVKDVDYTAEYVNNTAIGRATMKLKGIGNYTGSKDIIYNIVRRELTDPAVTISAIPDQDYTRSAVTPEIHIYCNGTELEKDKDYTVKYNNNTNPGTATAVVSATRTGGYNGTVTLEFNIVKNYTGIMGDMDGDEEITAGDALTILRSSVGISDISSDQELLADVNGDGQVDSSDALSVLRYSADYKDPGVTIGVAN